MIGRHGENDCLSSRATVVKLTLTQYASRGLICQWPMSEPQRFSLQAEDGTGGQVLHVTVTVDRGPIQLFAVMLDYPLHLPRACFLIVGLTTFSRLGRAGEVPGTRSAASYSGSALVTRSSYPIYGLVADLRY